LAVREFNVLETNTLLALVMTAMGVIFSVLS